MAETPQPHEDRAVPFPVGGLSEVALTDYEKLAEAWARQGWVQRAIALCKVLLRLEPGHPPTQRLLEELYSRRGEQLPASAGHLSKRVAPTLAGGEGVQGEEPPRPQLLSRLGQEELQSMLAALEPRVFQRGELILEQGQPGSSMFAIVEGSVEVVKTLKSGRRRTVALLGESDFFGEMSLLSDMPRVASIRAFERTAVLELTRERLVRLFQERPTVGEVLRGFYRERLLEHVRRDNAFFRALPTPLKEAVARELQVCPMPAETVLLVEGQPADALYFLVRGRCRVLRREPDGSERLVQTLGEGEVFGEGVLPGGLPATESVCTDTPCVLMRLERECCQAEFLQQPEWREALSRLEAERRQRAARPVREEE